jgi:hypothetical protein
MTLRKEAPRAKARWLGLAAVVGTFMLIFSSIAIAAIAPLTGSTFEGNDGNLVAANDGGTTDWSNVAGLHTGIDITSGKTDNSFGQGTKEDNADVTIVTGAIPPNKNDLTRFYEASEHVGGTVNSDFLYLAWERAVNIGNANLDFEINQADQTSTFTASTTGAITLNRTPGDMLVTYDFAGSGTPTIGILRWLTGLHTPDLSPGFATNSCFSANSFPCWGDQKTLDATQAEGAVNAVAVPEPISGNASLGIGLFGEAAINLTAAGVFPAGTCESFGSVFVKSRSSSSFPAELKDFIAPKSVSISNCGEVIVRKVTDPTGGTGFGFTSNVATNPTDSSNASFSLDDGGSKDIKNVLGGTYTVTETQPTVTNYTLTSIDCSAGTLAPTSTDTTTGVTTFTMSPGKVLDCTYTNTKAKNSPEGASSPSVIPQDTVTVSGLDTSGVADGAADQVMTVSLYDAGDTTCSGTAVYSQTFTVTDNVDYATTNSGDPLVNNGYTITASGVYNWQAHYDGDSRNNSFDVACGVENIDVTLTGTP